MLSGVLARDVVKVSSGRIQEVVELILFSPSLPVRALMLPASKIIIVIIIDELQVLKQNFRAAVCHVLHYSCNVNPAVADSLRCHMICGTVCLQCMLECPQRQQ